MMPLSRSNKILRWVLAVLGFVGIGLVYQRFGHIPALAVMMGFLMLVFFYGGSGGQASR